MPVFLLARRPSQFQLSIPLDYVETTIPPGMTIAAYRRSGRPHRSRPGRVWRRRVAAWLGCGPAARPVLPHINVEGGHQPSPDDPALEPQPA